MNHSGWKKSNRAHIRFQSYRRRILFIFMLTWGPLFTLPELASTYDMEKMGFISSIRGEVSISSGQFENEEIAHSRAIDQDIDMKERDKDQQIEQNVLEEIKSDPFIESENIRVISNNGVVTLKGTVKNLTARAAATADAFQGGAPEVKNVSKVRDNPMLTHKESDEASWLTEYFKYRRKVDCSDGYDLI